MGLTQLCPIDAPRPLRILGVVLGPLARFLDHLDSMLDTLSFESISVLHVRYKVL